jgi:hypothetical protein
MSVLRPLLSRRGRLVFVAAALLLIGALVAAPSVSGARNAVKQFTATILPDSAVGGVSDTWTEQVKNCGTPVEAPCTASSTIAIGQVRITVPSQFRATINSIGVTASDGSAWTVSYDSGTGVIQAQPGNGSNKLNSGDSVDITFSATPECTTGSMEFTTTAVGGLPSGPNNQTFSIVGLQPSVAVLGCALETGGTVTDPVTGQKETITGDFTGHVIVTFADGTADCSDDTIFGALGDQWEQYHLATPVTITPDTDFHAGSNPKISTSEFNQSIFGGDSSWYLICYAVPHDTAHPTPFATKGGGTATDIGGNWVGILETCDIVSAPCVSEQFLTTGPGSDPSLWDPTQDMVHISIELPAGDPHKS